MTSPLDSFVMVTFRAAADTPPAALALDGRTFYFPPEYLATIGSGPAAPGVIRAAGLDVRGYMNVAAGPTYEWVMTSGLAATALTFIDGIPPAPGWVDVAARETFVAQARAMRRDWAAPVAGIGQALTALYNAAAANRDAQHGGGG